MPATRSGRRANGPGSLLGHFQATKRSTAGTRPTTGKGKAVVKGSEAAQKQPSPVVVQQTPPAGPVPNVTTEQDAGRYSTPEAQTGSMPALASTSSTSPSPPPELLGSPTKALSVRQDPDRNKLYLMISPGKASPGASSSAQRIASQSAPSKLTRPMPYARQQSPTLDRTPIRHVDELFPKQPPSAPRKRRLSQVDMDRLRRRDNEESPLPHDKRRPSFRALGASQESGLSLMEVQSERDSPTDAAQSASPSGSDDELIVFTPRKVRETPSGITPPSFATPTKAARFEDPFSTPRPKPTISAGIFSSLVKPAAASSSARNDQQPAASSSDDDNPFLDVSSRAVAVTSAQGIPLLPYGLSPALPLPQHFNTVLLLHAALEHALVVHLATSGTAGSSTSSLDSTLTDTMGQSIVRLPNLITYSALRPLVERTSGRRLGPVELARLMYIWSGGRVDNAPAINAATAPTKAVISSTDRSTADTLSGLGFLLGRQRSLDGNGRRKWDWSLGIELTVKRARRQVTPPMQVSFGSSNGVDVEMPSTPTKRGNSGVFGLDTPPSTPPSKRKRENSGESVSPAGGVGREGMSFVALWNNGMEERKHEVGKRLRCMVAGEMETWLSGREQGGSVSTPAADAMEVDENAEPPSTPTHRSVQIGAGGLPTPSSTRPDGKRRRMVDFNTSIMEVDEDGRESERVLEPSQGSASGDAAWIKPSANEVLTTWPPAFELRTVAAIPCAVLPSLKEDREVAGLALGKTRTAAPSSSPEVEQAPSDPSRPLSLMERIKAKQLAAASSSSSSHRNGSMTNVKRRATLSRLPELASALYMLYSSQSTSSGDNTSRLPILPLSTVLSTLSKSSRVSLSPHEARSALDLLNELVPGFVEFKSVAGAEWVSLRGAGAGALAEVRRRVREELQ